jgi:tRNA U34 5-methylaminomethyl-2-thiouridine-forming methyltransferase MnmC
VFGRNEIDVVLTAMRDALREGRPEDARTEAQRARRIVDALASETSAAEAIADAATLAKTREAVGRATDPAFWDAFEPPYDDPAKDPLGALDWLDSRIAWRAGCPSTGSRCSGATVAGRRGRWRSRASTEGSAPAAPAGA